VTNQACLILLGLGAAIWAAGTLYFAYAGRFILETSSVRYWLSFALSPIISAALCVLILRWRHVATSDWAIAMLLIAIPGMIGESIVLTSVSTFMPRIREVSGGRYGAFLFATYAVVLSLAEWVSLRSPR
jgi:uncharacterized membrane protein YdjX (TVP38/TMEM64 family)